MIRTRFIELMAGVAAVAATGSLAYSALQEDGLENPPEAQSVVSPALLAGATTDNPCVKGTITFTFDDGPDIYTPQTLEVLRAFGVKAIFYVQGKNVKLRPEMVKEMIKDGHFIENHSWDHPHMADLDQADISRQLDDTQDAIEAAGAPRPKYFRPPFGNQSQLLKREVAKRKLGTALWTLDTNDWRGRAPDDIAATVIDGATPGAIVLMHDGVRNSVATVQALPKIIKGVRAKGFCTAQKY